MYAIEVTGENIDFINSHFNLDSEAEYLVSSGVSLQLLYHKEDAQYEIDAYCGKVATDQGVVTMFRNESELSYSDLLQFNNINYIQENAQFGLDYRSQKLLAQPGNGNELGQRSYSPGESFTISDLVDSDVYGFFQVDKDTELQQFERNKLSLYEKFKMFGDLIKEEPEYAVLEIGEILACVGSGLLYGAVVPGLWDYSGTLGVAGTLSSICNISLPGVNIAGNGYLGTMVDKVSNSDNPISGLKKIRGVRGLITGTTAVGYTLAQPEVIGTLADPSSAMIGLYCLAFGSLTSQRLLESKTRFAYRDELIRNNKRLEGKPYNDNFYQILGIEGVLENGVYLGAYMGSLYASTANPLLKFPLAIAGGTLMTAGRLAWAIYHKNPTVEFEVEADSILTDDHHIITDSGWDLEFNSNEYFVRKSGEHTYSIALEEGNVHATYLEDESELDVTHKHRWRSYMPKFTQGLFGGRKETWDINGEAPINITRYDKNVNVSVEVESNSFDLVLEQ